MSKVTPLAFSQITTTARIVIELVEDPAARTAAREPAVVIIRWPEKSCIIHPRCFPDMAATVAQLFAEAATQLAAIKAGWPL